MMMKESFNYKIMYFMHDNPILGRIRNPYDILRNIGIKEGMSVLDIGAGPGFFTIPAAKIVGPNGRVFALDIYFKSGEIIKNKMKKENLENIEFLLESAEKTSLPDSSIDFAIMFGIIHNIKFLEILKNELKRIIKSNGKIAIDKIPFIKNDIVNSMAEYFSFEKAYKNILVFKKMK